MPTILSRSNSHGKVPFPEVQSTRRELIKAIVDARDKLRTYARTAREGVHIPYIDDEGIWKASIDELLGTANLNPEEAKRLGLIKAPMFKDPTLRPQNLERVAVIRRNPSGKPAVRVFDKYGNQVAEYEASTASDPIGVDEAIQWVRRRYLQSEGGQDWFDIRRKAEVGRVGLGDTEITVARSTIPASLLSDGE